MRKSMAEPREKAVLTLSEGKWQEYRERDNYEQELQNFTGLLYIQDNNEHKILLQIVDIKFENLMKLSLQCNNIESIEPISQLYCPKLVQLQLGDNRITSVQALRRGNFEDLKVLSLRKNFITELKDLAELACVVRNLFLEWYDEKACCSDLSWCLKLETFQLKELILESRNRIVQQPVYRQIKTRYPSAKLSYNRLKTLY